MYQSSGTVGLFSMPSLGTLKCTISGDNPLAYNDQRNEAIPNKNYTRCRIIGIHASPDELHACLPVS